MRQEEPEPVYRVLVDALADNVVPMIVLCGMIVAAGIYIWWIGPSGLVPGASLLCAMTMVAKIATILDHQRHRAAYRAASLDRVRRHEVIHGITSIAVCLSVSLFAVTVYALPNPALYLLPIAISFGYSAGLIARVSIRPHIAGAAILCLVVPNALAMAVMLKGYLFIALILAVFALAGLQSVAFVYATARRAVTLRLELEGLARCDPLTGLLNRLGLREAFETLAGARNGQSVVVHALDLDGFKGVNDRLGHLAGDQLLAVIADRIQAHIPAGMIAARTGGDEFVVIHLGDETSAKRLARRLHDELTRPCDLGLADPVSVGLSLGYAVGNVPGAGMDGLIQKADARSYAVKRAGGGIRGFDVIEEPPQIAASAARRVSRRA